MNRTLFFNGPILTMESPMPTDALLVEDGRVVALGADALGATGATNVDLQGDALMPAFSTPTAIYLPPPTVCSKCPWGR